MKPYALGPRAIEQLRRVVRNDVQRAVRRQLGEKPQHSPAGPAIYLAKTPAGGIAAMAGTTPGSADCTVYGIVDGELTEMEDSEGEAIEVTVYNVAANAVDGETVIQCKEESATGALLADFEDCD